jgi:hypothetical protein
MFRPATVAVSALAVGVLALIALLMGVFATIPGSGPARCGHLLDSAHRQGSACTVPLRTRRVEVAAVSGVAGGAAIVALVAVSKALEASR